MSPSENILIPLAVRTTIELPVFCITTPSRTSVTVTGVDVVEVDIGGRVDRYVVQRTWIVDPADVWVLDATESPAVTLVTCYPFYFIGSAPQRFVVRALREAAPASTE